MISSNIRLFACVPFFPSALQSLHKTGHHPRQPTGDGHVVQVAEVDPKRVAKGEGDAGAQRGQPADLLSAILTPS